MNIREKIANPLQQAGLVLASFLLAVAVTGCSSKVHTVQFKINSEPEGSHVVLNVSGPKLPNSADWIYLGHTPIRGVRQINKDKVAKANKITLKVMHAGYYDQIREWDGEAFWNEAVERGVIFWTPELILHPNSE
jgi:hypothetical protein